MLPGASVTAKHPASGLTAERVTDAEGRFFFPAMRIGQWEIAVVMPGFAPQNQNVGLEIGRTLNLELTLSLEGLAEQVTVATTAPLLQTFVSAAAVADCVRRRNGIDSKGRHATRL